MILYPNVYFKSITEVTYEYLIENNIKALILDVDNTLIDYERNLSYSVIKWVEELKNKNIKMYIVSNSNHQKKVKHVADKLKLDYIFFAMKPLKYGFKKAKKNLGLQSKQIAVIGDQIFTDVIGANRMKMHSILVEPIKEKDIWITRIKRPIENAIKRKYFKYKEEK